MQDVKDSITGALVGLAVGDALGTTLEFSERDSFPPVTGMTGGGHFSLRPGQWTDDTSMALCLADSLIQTGTFDLRDQLQRYARWVEEGYFSSTGKCFGIGRQTLRALGDFNRTGRIVAADTGTRTAGNGSLMRLAPVPMVFHRNLGLVAKVAAASSLTTHPNIECVEACGAYGRLIAGAILGWDKNQILAESRVIADQITSPAVREVLSGSYLTKSRGEISSSGYVVHTMEAALWAFTQTNDFSSGALLAVNLAGDADTIGAIYGQLAGAHYGASGIPVEWVKMLHESEIVVAMAEQLHDLTNSIEITEESATYLPVTA